MSSSDDPFDASPDGLEPADDNPAVSDASILIDASNPRSTELDGGSDASSFDAGYPPPANTASSVASALDAGTPDAATVLAPRAARAPLIQGRPDQKRPE